MKRFSVICSQCGLSVDRLIDAETAQTEIYPVPYQQKCKIAPNAADFDRPELERAVERARRWDPIFRTGIDLGHRLMAEPSSAVAAAGAKQKSLFVGRDAGGGDVGV
jgi:hypothetical protein